MLAHSAVLRVARLISSLILRDARFASPQDEDKIKPPHPEENRRFVSKGEALCYAASPFCITAVIRLMKACGSSTGSPSTIRA